MLFYLLLVLVCLLLACVWVCFLLDLVLLLCDGLVVFLVLVLRLLEVWIVLLVCWLLVVFVGGIVVCTMGFMWWFLVGLVLCNFL